ncbi:MAG: BNR-4 repeat-containing protein [Pirellulales bacterium]
MRTHPVLILVCLLGVSSTARSAEPSAGDLFPIKSISSSGFEPAVRPGNTIAGDSTTPKAGGAMEVAPGVRRFATGGGWCWFQDPRALIHNGKLIVGSVSGSGSQAGDVRCSVYDLEADRELGTFVLHPKLQSDDHSAPVFYVRPDRRILAVYASHTSPAHYYRISEPGDPTRWQPEQTFKHPHSITYMNLYHHRSDDTLYNFYRDTRGTYCPAYLTSKDHGTTWQPGGQLIFHGFEGRHRPYPRYWSDGEFIHVSFTEAHPQEYRNGCGIYYAKFKAGKFHRADGSLIKDIRKDGPLLPREAETVFHGAPEHKAWTSSIVTGSQRRIYVAYSVNRSASDHRFRYAVWDGTRWADHEVAYAGPGLYPKAYDYTGLITIDPSDPGRVYFSTNVDPAHGTCNTSGKHEMYEAATADLGKTWKFTALTWNSSATNMRPVCVAGEKHVAVLWMHGRYSTYVDYDTDIVGFIRRR